MGLFSIFKNLAGKGMRPLRDYIVTSWLQSSSVSDAGQIVTPDIAMAASAVFACVNVIASTIATLPVCVIRKRDMKRLDDHPVYKILNSQINPEMTAAAGREAFMVNLLLWGNGFAFIEKGDSMRPAALWPLRAQATTPQRDPGSDLFYRSVTGGATYTFGPDQMLHAQDLSYDGIVGLSRVRYGSNPIGLALAMEKYGAKFFSNGGSPGGILELPPGMKKEAVEAFKKSWKENFTGIENSLKTALLTDGMKFTRTGIEPIKSQMIDTRVFQVREVARLWRVPLHKIGDTEQATFSNIEQLNIEFANDTIRPWAVKLNQEFNRKLLLESEQDEIEIKHDLDSICGADMAGRYSSYNTALQSGWMTRNEVRAKEGLPPIPGGDEPLQPLNMGTPGGNPDTSKKPAAKPTKEKVKVTVDPATDDLAEEDDSQEE